MGLIDGFDHDIFISYAHDDNLDFLVREPAEGWVLDFAKVLKTGLSAKLKKETRLTDRNLQVFWDKSQLQQGEPLDWELNDHVEKSAIFCIFMSQNYLDSEWCRQELDWFLKTLENRKDRLSREASGRLWPVIVVSVGPTVQTDWPDEILQRGMPFEFYDKNENGRDPRYAYPSISVTPDPSFYEEFTKLETTLSRRIKKAIAKDSDPGDVMPATTPEGTQDIMIHGSEVSGSERAVLFCTDDMIQKAKRFEAQCQQAGIDVTRPRLDMDSNNSAEDAGAAIIGAKAVILMLGVYPGVDEEAKTRVLQAAFDKAVQDKVTHLVWMQKGLKPTLIDKDFENYANFVTELKSSILSSGLEELQAELLKSMKPAEKESDEVVFQGRVKLFIDAAKIDYDIAQQIRAKLRTNKLNVRTYLPQADADQKAHNDQWNNIVEKCDGIILVYGRIDIDAIDDKLDQIWRLSARRRSKSMPEISVAIIDTPPPSGYDVDEPGIQVITAKDKIDFTEISKFITDLQSSGGPGAAA